MSMSVVDNIMGRTASRQRGGDRRGEHRERVFYVFAIFGTGLMSVSTRLVSQAYRGRRYARRTAGA